MASEAFMIYDGTNITSVLTQGWRDEYFIQPLPLRYFSLEQSVGSTVTAIHYILTILRQA